MTDKQKGGGSELDRQEGSGGKVSPLPISREEWGTTHRDYKTIIDGQKFMLRASLTELVPVVITCVEKPQHWFYCATCKTLNTDRRKTHRPFGGECVCVYYRNDETGHERRGYRRYLGLKTESEARAIAKKKEWETRT